MTKKYSNKQLVTIRDFGKKSMGGLKVLHSGCFGCGKTYCLMVAFGLYCLQLKKLGFTKLNFILMGRTQKTVKTNMCNVLAKLFGADFKYDSSKKDGINKDATLFGQYIYFVGLNDSSAEIRIRGLSDIMGCIHDEAVLCTEELFSLIMSRLRGDSIQGLPDDYLQHWYIGSTNPDVPTHFIKKMCDNGLMNMIRWYRSDACWDGADKYYEDLAKQFKDNPTHLARYLNGEWTSSDRMVYPMFSERHILPSNDIDIKYSDMQYMIIGADYGSDHKTALTLIAKNYQGVYIVCAEIGLQRTAPSDIVQRIADWITLVTNSGSYVKYIFVDPSAVALKDELTKRAINYNNAMNKHDAGIGKIQTLLSTDKLFMLDSCTELINEMYSYQYKDTTNGKDEVIKVGDDFSDSLRYGVYTDSVIGG